MTNEVEERMRTEKYTVRCYKAKEICILCTKVQYETILKHEYVDMLEKKTKSDFTKYRIYPKASHPFTHCYLHFKIYGNWRIVNWYIALYWAWIKKIRIP